MIFFLLFYFYIIWYWCAHIFRVYLSMDLHVLPNPGNEFEARPRTMPHNNRVNSKLLRICNPHQITHPFAFAFYWAAIETPVFNFKLMQLSGFDIKYIVLKQIIHVFVLCHASGAAFDTLHLSVAFFFHISLTGNGFALFLSPIFLQLIDYVDFVSFIVH